MKVGSGFEHCFSNTCDEMYGIKDTKKKRKLSEVHNKKRYMVIITNKGYHINLLQFTCSLLLPCMPWQQQMSDITCLFKGVVPLPLRHQSHFP